jgi:hypothetical protein
MFFVCKQKIYRYIPAIPVPVLHRVLIKNFLDIRKFYTSVIQLDTIFFTGTGIMVPVPVPFVQKEHTKSAENESTSGMMKVQ